MSPSPLLSIRRNQAGPAWAPRGHRGGPGRRLAPAQVDLDVVGDLLGRDPAVAVAVAGREPGGGRKDLAGAEAAVAVEVQEAEQGSPLVRPGQGEPVPGPEGAEGGVLGDLARIDLAVAVTVDRLEQGRPGGRAGC